MLEVSIHKNQNLHKRLLGPPFSRYAEDSSSAQHQGSSRNRSLKNSLEEPRFGSVENSNSDPSNPKFKRNETSILYVAGWPRLKLLFVDLLHVPASGICAEVFVLDKWCHS